MPNILGLTEATSLAFHAMLILAGTEDKKFVSNREIASKLEASQHHLSKVMQRLERSGLVNAERGPKGGFRLGRPSEKISLLEIYEILDGPFKFDKCLMGRPLCERNHCIFKDLPERIENSIYEHLSKTTLWQLANED